MVPNVEARIEQTHSGTDSAVAGGKHSRLRHGASSPILGVMRTPDIGRWHRLGSLHSDCGGFVQHLVDKYNPESSNRPMIAVGSNRSHINPREVTHAAGFSSLVRGLASTSLRECEGDTGAVREADRLPFGRTFRAHSPYTPTGYRMSTTHGVHEPQSLHILAAAHNGLARPRSMQLHSRAGTRESPELLC